MVMKGHALDILSIVLILGLSRFVLPGKTTLLLWLILICVLSRSNLIYHSMNLEVHSILMVFVAITYGFWVCAYIAILSTSITNTVSGWIGIYNPILTLMDTLHMLFVAIFASLLTLQNYFIPVIIILLFAELIREGFRFFTYHENFIKYLIMGTFFMMMFYFVLHNWPGLFINFVGG